MKIKFSLLLALLLVPQLAFARPTPKDKQKTAQIANLIEKSASFYRKVKTFSGTIDLTFTELDGDDMKPVFEAQMRTIYRLDKAGNKIREVTTLYTRTHIDDKPVSRTLKVVDDGKTQTQISIESKTYSLTPRYNEVAPFALLAPSLKRIARALRQDDLAMSSKTEAGPFTEFYSEGGKFFVTLNGVLNDKIGTLETLDFSTGTRGIRIRTSEQVFNPRLSESQFKWTPPANFKQVEENQLPNPLQGLEPKPKPTATPVW